MKGGTKRKPDHLKVLSGTDQPIRMSGSEPVGEVLTEPPEPPDWLNEHGIPEFRRLAGIMTAWRVLTEAHIAGLAVFCDLYGDIIQKRRAGIEVPAHRLAQFRGLLNDLALTPTSVAKPRASSEPKNRFARHGAARRGA